MHINFKFVAPLAVSAALVAQVPQDPGSKAIPLSKVERKNKAPVSSEILRVKLPKPVEMTLPNGLTVLVLEDHRLPLVSVRLAILGAGALNDPADLPGLANITAAMLKEGTATRSSKQIAEETEKLGLPSERRRRGVLKPPRSAHPASATTPLNGSRSPPMSC